MKDQHIGFTARRAGVWAGSAACVMAALALAGAAAGQGKGAPPGKAGGGSGAADGAAAGLSDPAEAVRVVMGGQAWREGDANSLVTLAGLLGQSGEQGRAARERVVQHVTGRLLGSAEAAGKLAPGQWRGLE